MRTGKTTTNPSRAKCLPDRRTADYWIPTPLLKLSLPRLRRFGKLSGPPAIFNGVIHRGLVMSDDLVGRSEHLDLAVAKPQTALARPAEVSHLVIYHDHGMALFEDRFYPLKAFL